MDRRMSVTDEPSPEAVQQAKHDYEASDKSFWDRLWPVIACGAGLFSDGYLNGVIGPVGTMLQMIYPTEYQNSPAQSNVTAITFAGTVVGDLLFGYLSDHWSRKWSLFTSTIIILVFAALSAGSYGAGGSIEGLFAALTAYRFLLGIGIGGEYPSGSVACAESTGELKEGTRNRWFIMFTNVQIDIGTVIASLVPMIVVLITGQNHLGTAWRLCLALGILPPLSLLYLRIKLSEPESFKKESMAETKTPWGLVIKFYWFRLLAVSAIWFIYDFSGYSFSILSSQVVANLIPDGPLWKTFGWSTLINFFYLPGCIGGAYLSDYVGPVQALGYGVLAQSLVGFLTAGVYSYLVLPQNVAGFVILFGVFLALGELGPGDNIGLIASKTSATAVRGKYYGVAAALGKIGAFVGTKVLEILFNQYKDTDKVKAGQYPFLISSALCLLSAVLAFTCLPRVDQDTIALEDARFRLYLEEHGYDTSAMGTKGEQLEGEARSATEEVSPERDAKTDRSESDEVKG